MHLLKSWIGNSMLSRFKKNNFYQFCILLLILFSELYAQDFENHYRLKLKSDLSDYWWSTYNNYGQENSKTNFNYSGNYKKNNTQYYFSFFISKDRISIGESFLKYKISDKTYIKAGRYYRDFSNYLNNSLSSGSILISHNAQPMPKFGLMGSLHLKKSYNFDYGIAHGIFEKNNFYNDAPMLHEKFIYLKQIKKETEWGIGLVHEAIWGGNTIGGRVPGDQPSTFKDFLKIIIAEDGPEEGEDHVNALGNHLGIWDFYYQMNKNDKILKLYYQHFFEDTSGLRFANKSDGLWGIELKDYIKDSTILLEYLNTSNQDTNPPYLDDTYYIHGLYQSGWSYKGYVLGNPFIDSLNNNPSKVIHLGIKKNTINEYNYKLLLSRKIHESDFIKYQILFGKMINNFLVDIFFVGEKSNGGNVGIKLSYQL